jgi:hypothetical protein
MKNAEGELIHGNVTDRRLLQMAHDNLVKAAGVQPKPVEAPKDPKAEAAKARVPDTSTVPPSLGHIPAAAPGSVDTEEFAHLDKIFASGDSAAHERALAKLTADQQDRYLRGAG